ncbi:MAG: hypothetical protein J1F03_00135 [Oscillospiraceae bacterium]|nr:hypothetical protein [Oscillospiraceae bacterium]
MDFKFDLENAAIELEHINHLLGIFNEFVSEECPEKDKNKRDKVLAAMIFADRMSSFQSLIYAAQDKIIAMHDEMEASIEKYFSDKKKEAAKKGGDAA